MKRGSRMFGEKWAEWSNTSEDEGLFQNEKIMENRGVLQRNNNGYGSKE
jgi:hypothetical protein